MPHGYFDVDSEVDTHVSSSFINRSRAFHCAHWLQLAYVCCLWHTFNLGPLFSIRPTVILTHISLGAYVVFLLYIYLEEQFLCHKIQKPSPLPRVTWAAKWLFHMVLHEQPPPVSTHLALCLSLPPSFPPFLPPPPAHLYEVCLHYQIFRRTSSWFVVYFLTFHELELLIFFILLFLPS